MCVHEAAHADVYALGGVWVYRVAVTPLGSTGWQTTGRKGSVVGDLLGMCSTADSPASLFIRWDDEQDGAVADRRAFTEMLRRIDAASPGAARECRRQVRAHLCACLAGPAAEQLHQRPDETPYLDEGDGGPDDIALAWAHSWLLIPPMGVRVAGGADVGDPEAAGCLGAGPFACRSTRRNRLRIPLIADTHSRLIADSVPGDRGHPGWSA